MKRIFFISSLFLSCYYLPAQELLGKIKIALQERYTKQILSNTNFTLVLNASDTTYSITDNEGSYLTKEIKKGKYDVMIRCADYKTQSINGIVIGEGKTAYVTFGMSPNREYTKKEKKLYGIK